MTSAKNLTEDQKRAIGEWAAEGAQLPEIQKRLKEQFGFNATYMDTRFLILDLGIELRTEEPEDEDEDDAEFEQAFGDGDDEAPIGGLKMTIDDVVRPGAIVSGHVTFSDGETGVWMIDHLGRPALDPGSRDYMPSEEDMMAMERELRRILEQLR